MKITPTFDTDTSFITVDLYIKEFALIFEMLKVVTEQADPLSRMWIDAQCLDEKIVEAINKKFPSETPPRDNSAAVKEYLQVEKIRFMNLTEIKDEPG